MRGRRVRPAAGHGRGVVASSAVDRAASGVLAIVAAVVTVSVFWYQTAGADDVLQIATPSADTFVSSSAPDTDYGRIKYLYADGSPTKISLLRFPVTGVSTGSVVRATLRLNVADGSPTGGTVHTVAPTWSESTTWSTRPAVGAAVAQIGAVAESTWTDIDVTSVVTADGDVDLAVVSTDSDGAAYASRQSVAPPQLVIQFATDPSPDPGGEQLLAVVTGPLEGSSAPTAFANSHRIARTAAGRELVVHGRHGLGAQLAWRDGNGSWSYASRGSAYDGMLITGTGTGDWPASIVIGRDGDGVEHAWAAYGGDAATSNKPVYLRRISELDDPAGPVLGPPVVISPAGNGAGIVDIALEHAAARGAVTWAARNESGSFEQRVAWFTDLDVAESPVSPAIVRTAGSSGYRSGTLVSTPTGVALVYRNGVNRLQVDVHRASDPFDVWSSGGSGMVVPSKAHISAVALATGELVATAATNVTSSVQSVQVFSDAGTPSTPELTLSGYRDGTLATDGADVWMVAVRVDDGALVSRERNAGSWSTIDVVVLGDEGGGGYGWPNLLREADDDLRIVVQGPAGSSVQRSVLSVVAPIVS